MSWTQFSTKEVFCEACKLTGFIIAGLFFILFLYLVLP